MHALTFAAATPLALADPPIDPAADPGPPPDNGVVASADPGVVTTPDGWMLTVVATDESQLPIAPLTTAVSSREYLVGGTFTGTVTGKGKTIAQRWHARSRVPDRLRHRARTGPTHRPGRCQYRRCSLR